MVFVIRLCRSNSRIYLFIKTLQYSGKALLSSALMFAIVFSSDRGDQLLNAINRVCLPM